MVADCIALLDSSPAQHSNVEPTFPRALPAVNNLFAKENYATERKSAGNDHHRGSPSGRPTADPTGDADYVIGRAEYGNPPGESLVNVETLGCQGPASRHQAADYLGTIAA
jgi:hypothetical protein